MLEVKTIHDDKNIHHKYMMIDYHETQILIGRQTTPTSTKKILEAKLPTFLFVKETREPFLGGEFSQGEGGGKHTPTAL